MLCLKCTYHVLPNLTRSLDTAALHLQHRLSSTLPIGHNFISVSGYADSLSSGVFKDGISNKNLGSLSYATWQRTQSSKKTSSVIGVVGSALTGSTTPPPSTQNEEHDSLQGESFQGRGVGTLARDRPSQDTKKAKGNGQDRRAQHGRVQSKSKTRRESQEGKSRTRFAVGEMPREQWQIQKKALSTKFPIGWSPRKRLSPDALDGIRALNTKDPVIYDTQALAKQFEVSPEAIRRILKSKWKPSEDEENDRKRRWENRGQKIWDQMSDIGVKPPRRWRQGQNNARGLSQDGGYTGQHTKARKTAPGTHFQEDYVPLADRIL